MEVGSPFAYMTTKDLASVLAWLDAHLGLSSLAILSNEAIADPEPFLRLYAALCDLRTSRWLTGDDDGCPASAAEDLRPRSLGYACVLCNQREATDWGPSRVSGGVLAVCATCLASHPGLLHAGEARPWVRTAPAPRAALPPLPPAFPRMTQIPKTGVPQPLVLGDVLPLDDQGTWRVVGEDAQSYECELVQT